MQFWPEIAHSIRVVRDWQILEVLKKIQGRGEGLDILDPGALVFTYLNPRHKYWYFRKIVRELF